jgi:hypothetical protein
LAVGNLEGGFPTGFGVVEAKLSFKPLVGVLPCVPSTDPTAVVFKLKA